MMNIAAPAAVDLDFKNKSRAFESSQENTEIWQRISEHSQRNSRVQSLHQTIVKTADRIWIG
jgi:hypothetical protein